MFNIADIMNYKYYHQIILLIKISNIRDKIKTVETNLRRTIKKKQANI